MSVSGPTYLNNKPLVSKKKNVRIFLQKKKIKIKIITLISNIMQIQYQKVTTPIKA